MAHLHDRMDKLFANGRNWHHRTLRTVFDPLGNEWNETTMAQKIDILKKIVASGENLQIVYMEYLKFYKKEKPHVANDAWQSLIIYVEALLPEKDAK